MLVLSRRPETAIHIGSNIKVTVLSIRKGVVRVGIDAPSSVRIWRDELCRCNPTLLGGKHGDLGTDETTDKNDAHQVEAFNGPVF